MSAFSIDEARFKRLSETVNIIPVHKEIVADTETPVSAFMKLGDAPYSYIFESVQGGDKWGRYTFIGFDPILIVEHKGNRCSVTDKNGETVLSETDADPLARLERIMSRFKPADDDRLPRFYGGAVGFLAYDAIRFFEKMPETAVDRLTSPDAQFFVCGATLIFDNILNKLKIVAIAHIDGSAPAEQIYQRACDKIDRIIQKLAETDARFEPVEGSGAEPIIESDTNKDDFIDNVKRAIEYIEAGDAFQIVLTQSFSAKLTAPPFQLYRALRTINPSPYMYYLNLGANHKIVGASPEALIRVVDGIIETRPIAGTRPRGATEEEDQRLIADLLADEKELAEHLMLVDLARNDVGRVAVGGSVEVSEFQIIEKYSHVSHIVSNVRGRLKPEFSAYDALRAAFPAGTLSGAPKIRAMEIIEELEKRRRGLYSGAVGYFSFSGNTDIAIAIRTAQIIDNIAHVGAGAGIVADSIPEKEFEESVNKAKALIAAIKLSENRLDLTRIKQSDHIAEAASGGAQHKTLRKPT